MPSQAAAAAVTDEGGKDERGDHVEEEDDRDCLGHVLVVSADHGSRCRDGRAAADGGAHADERGDLCGHVHGTAHHEGDDERRRDGGDDHRKARGPDPRDLREVESEAQKDDGSLKDVLGRELDARLQRRDVTTTQRLRQEHAKQDAEDRPANHIGILAASPGDHGDCQAKQKALGLPGEVERSSHSCPFARGPIETAHSIPSNAD